MKQLRVITIILHFVVGVFGLMGGFAAISSPNGPFGISTDVLKNGPFSNFLIPGLTLFIVIGIGHIITGIIVIKRNKYFPYVQGIMAAITVGWIIIQCWVMQDINALHIVIFIIGSVQGIHAGLELIKNKMFPVNIIMKKIGNTN